MLERLVDLQLKAPWVILGLGAVMTVVMGAGITQIELQTDFQESLPQDLAPLQAQDKLEAEFGSPEAIIILFETTEGPLEESDITDVRDPRLVESLLFLEHELMKEPLVRSVNSLGSLFERVPNSTEVVKQRLAGTEASFVNRDFTATTMLVTLDGEMNEETIERSTQVIRDNIDEMPLYPGIDVAVTGLPVIRTTVSSVIVNDSITTVAIATILILGLLVLTRGFVNGVITFIPLFAGLIWTLGALGYLGIPLTVVTLSLGSMILGLGVEYGSFIVERILEESDNGIESAIRTAIPNTGKAILGSATTDGIGFLALLLATITFFRDLGLSLALGEFLTVTAALTVTPALMVVYERGGWW